MEKEAGEPETGLGGDEEERNAEEPVVSLAEVLAENEELEKEARAVLGGSDHERCSYSQGAVKRQALYACSTCTPPGEEPAGICLACSYECHGTHKLFELYTKRNFRCDCGNSKFKNLQCKLLPEKANVNPNKYNDNFYGLYCVCKRPYPDPEDEIPDEMIQCIVCEDWFHGRHLGAVPPDSGDFHEMVCQACMDRCPFLWAYASQLAVPTVTKVTLATEDGVVLNVEENEDVKKENGADHQVKTEEEKLVQNNEPSTSSASTCKLPTAKNEASTCKLQELQAKQYLKKNTATFWPHTWRSKLCTCRECVKMYSDLDIPFLTDECDTVLAYENKGTRDQEADRRDPLMDTLSSMDRVQQVELICEYNDLKTELKDYLRRFADEGTVVKREDIQQFFEEFQSRKRRRTDRMQYYCS
ncbi:putative E3 ubiquitin-protein ligase UBR7 [Hemicordylus capensis]|uniref:putative E3 ubiquitin-protein ligase UBR7 n=1 Tax=Hemicordylus capensis TaxID=884348 RepID=UPI002302FD53|nr:putative E3 ubiquitin-protein ligase UBR7 [Hemicordylus capensis]